MRKLLRRTLSVFLCELLILLTVSAGGGGRQTPPAKSAVETASLRGYLQRPYLELFELSPKLEVSAREIEAQRKSLEKGKKLCVTRFKGHAKTYGKQIDGAQKDLKKKTTGITEDQRKQAHCTIQNLELLKAEADVLSGQAIPTAYDNLNAKLDIIQKWPSLYKQTQQDIANGTFNNRRWGNVKDIGFREIAAGQQDDIKKGQQAIEELKRSGILPPEVEDKKIQEYVNTVAQLVAQHSDLKIPLHVSVLQSREVNAFALPGGYLFIERGLLEAADEESELAGVIAHEIAHDTARHSNKLMKRATIAGIFYQAAQIAAMVLNGGVAGIGMYYALQYGFYGLGLVLDLKLLWVSREYELEADQLGVQYAWNSGYDPTGFTRFFDKMATKQGYVNGVSWFRTHPPFYTRMVETQREIMFLPKKEAAVVQTAAFEAMKKELAPIASAAEKEEAGKPSLLLQREQGCEPPKKLEFKAGEPIEDLCARGPVAVPNPK
ncbi:MAG TPA: M48 family metalloprotease [Candidatus Acidoferrales bacterium]|nr:M48 family metalloprotease [Candidatus Acidoferrales bacterium]